MRLLSALQFTQRCTQSSFGALLANRGRSFLTMLGIIIGVGAVIVIVSVGAGAQSLILGELEDLGSDIIGVLPGNAEDNGPPASAFGIVVTTLTYEDAQALTKPGNVPHLVEAVAFARGASTVSWQSNSYDTNINGTMANYMSVEGGELASGRFFTPEEERDLSRVAVLGSVVAEELFGLSDPVGQNIKIKKHSFQVIGVMKERGTVAFQDYDDQVIVPLVTAQKILLGIQHVSLIRARVDAKENIPATLEDVRATLRHRHDINDSTGANDDFSVRSLAQALDILTTITDALRFFLAAMAALSLVVGGIGIMNIMLARVTERTREIGLRMAIGATKGAIMGQFLVEALAITLVGGAIGMIGGFIASYFIAIIASLLDYAWAFSISLTSIVLALGVSLMVGVIFGLYPARKASSLQPVEALRYE